MDPLLALVLLVLVLAVAGSHPAWPHSSRWGYAPFGSLAFVLVVVVVALLLWGRPGRLPPF